MSRRYPGFPTITSIAKNAIIVIYSRITRRNHQVSYDELSEQLPYERTNLFSPLLEKNVTVKTVHEALDRILFPFEAPQITSFSYSGPSAIEVGESIAATSYTFNFVVTNPENVDGNLTLSNSDNGDINTGINPTATSITQALESEITKTNSTNTTFTLSGVDKEGNTFSRSFLVSWRWKRFFFTYASGGDLPSEGDLLVGNRPNGDDRDAAITPANLGTKLDTMIDNGDITEDDQDLNQGVGHKTRSWDAPGNLGSQDDFRLYFIYKDGFFPGALVSSLGSEIAYVQQVFSWERNGVTGDYIIVSVDQDFSGSQTPQIGVV